MSTLPNINTDILKGKWNQVKGQVRQQWGEITDNELEQIAGKRDELIGTLQLKYGHSREKAEQEVNQFLSKHM